MIKVKKIDLGSDEKSIWVLPPGRSTEEWARLAGLLPREPKPPADRPKK